MSMFHKNQVQMPAANMLVTTESSIPMVDNLYRTAKVEQFIDGNFCFQHWNNNKMIDLKKS